MFKEPQEVARAGREKHTGGQNHPVLGPFGEPGWPPRPKVAEASLTGSSWGKQDAGHRVSFLPLAAWEAARAPV